jgi:adenosylmethionine-8-amino-7-oxononanoate aminotransferase
VPKVFEAHLSTDRAKMFFHSSSYTANPIACAAALANIGVWEKEPVRERIKALTGLQAERMSRFAGDRRFTGARQLGTIAALDLAVADQGYLSSVGLKLGAFFLERGLLLRPLGNTIYVLPPYCVTGAELDLVYGAISDAASALA